MTVKVEDENVPLVDERETKAGWVEELLRRAIVTGVLEPGSRLRVGDLAQGWRCSPTPLREAIHRLAGDGLVELWPQRGARVAALSATEAAEIYELRLLLDPVALRQSLEASDKHHHAAMRFAFSTFRSATGVVEKASAHNAFHRALLSRCPSSWLLRVTALLADHSVRYQLASVGSGAERRHPLREHKALLDAAVAGDVEGAVSLLVAHLDRTRRSATAE